MTLENNDTASADFDGTLLPMGSLAVNPALEEDLANLIAHVPVCMAGALARMAAWRSMGMAADWQGFPLAEGEEDLSRAES